MPQSRSLDELRKLSTLRNSPRYKRAHWKSDENAGMGQALDD